MPPWTWGSPPVVGAIREDSMRRRVNGALKKGTEPPHGDPRGSTFQGTRGTSGKKRRSVLGRGQAPGDFRQEDRSRLNPRKYRAGSVTPGRF